MALIRARVSLLFLLALPVAAPVHAQDGAGLDEEARALYQAGLSAYNNGRFESALVHFTHGYETSDRAAFLYNIGLTQERLFQLPEALAAYRGYLEGVPQAPNRNLVEARIEQIERQLEGAGDSGADTTDETATGAESGSDGQETTEDPGTTDDGSEPVEEDSPGSDGGGGGGLMVAGFAIAGGGAALILVGAITGGLAISELDAIENTCSPSCTPEETSGGETLALVTDVLLISGGVIAAAGLIMGIVGLTSGGGDGDRAAIRFSPVVGPSLAGGFVEGSF